MYKIKPLTKVKKIINIPPDKSISHRAVIISALASGKTVIFPFLLSEDTLATLKCVRLCGVKAKLNKKTLTVEGEGLYFPKKKEVTLYAGQSGTTLRVFSGVLAGQKFKSCFKAHPLLRERPMARITKPLRLMGADIRGQKSGKEEFPPLNIKPVKKINGVKYKLPVASAQVKSAVLFASLYADKKTEVTEPLACRDHSERMLNAFAARIKRQGNKITSLPVKKLISPKKIFIPSDFSSAAFFIVLGLILKNSKITLRNISLNATRNGLLKVLLRMGAKISVTGKKNYFEPYGGITVKSSFLKGVNIKEKEVPLMIDEVPILCVAASFAKGKTTIKGLKELKVKESDRLNSTVYNLRKAGVKISAEKYTRRGKQDWMLKIEGCKKFKPANFKSFSDHRTAMSAVILGSAIRGCAVDDIKCINKSFPEFINLIQII